MSNTSARLYYLDWIRVGAFALLILYHVGMFYVSWDWHVKSDHAGHTIEPLMLLTNPWRLTLLFIVSGVATRFMVEKSSLGKFSWRRSLRLFVPLAFAMAVIVPPQSYYEVVEKISWPGSYLEFWRRYLRADGSFCKGGDCLILPTWNHMWFVAYLLVYTWLLAILLAFARKPLLALGGRLATLPAAAMLLAPMAYLIAIRLFLLPYFEVTHALVDDWYNHALSFAAFLFGFLALRDQKAAQTFIQLRWLTLALFAVSYIAFAAYAWAYREPEATPASALVNVMRVIYAIDQWSGICAVLGFGALYLNRDHPVLRTLTIAVFPAYIVHQSVIVAVGHNLKALHLPALVEGSVLIGATALGCWGAFELARRIGWLGLLLGVGAPRTPAPAARQRAGVLVG